MSNLLSGSMIILLAALILLLAGIGLLIHGARMTREAVSKRIDLIRPSADISVRSAPLASAQVHSGQRGIEQRERLEMARLLFRLGFSASKADEALIGVRLFMVVVLAALTYLGTSHWTPVAKVSILPLLLSTALGISGWFIPAMIIRHLIKTRTKAIVAGLPDSLELLVICVEAGLSFEDGIDRIAIVLQKSQPALAEELALTAADLKILPSREAALGNLAARVDTPSVRSVVTTLSQTLRYGTPLAQALRVVAGELRNDTLMRLEERANQLPTLMTIPMMLFIMPTIFMIVAGPAALRIIDTFRHH